MTENRNRERLNKRKGETRYQEGKIKAMTVGLADSQVQHIEEKCAEMNHRKPGSGWNRSRYIQRLIDDDMKKAR